MPDVLTDLSPQAIVTATKDNLYSLVREFRRSSVCETSESDHAYYWHTSVPHPWFNGVLSFREPADSLRDAVEHVTHWMESHDVHHFTWWLSPHLDVNNWRARMTDYGFHYDSNTPGMAVHLDGLPDLQPLDLHIEPVTRSEMLMMWTETFIQGYGLPAQLVQPFYELTASLGLDLPFRHYLGFAEGKPVATSTLYLGAGVAGIYYVATISDARGKGYGRAMTHMPLTDARKLGYKIGVLQSSDMGQRVYERLGFVTQCQMDHFYWHF